MKGFFIRLAIGGIICFFFSPASQAALKIQEVVSSQGIKAWLVEDHTVPVISLRLSFRAGTAYVSPEQAGLVDVLAHMLDEGAGPLNSREFHEKLQKLAIELNFDCNPDEFQIFLRTTTTYHREAFDLLKFAITQARFEEKEFKKIRSASLTALKVQEKTPDYLVTKTFQETLLKHHPYERLKGGTEKTLKKLRPEDLKAFVKKAFAKDALTVGVCGDMTPQELKEALDRVFGDLPDKSGLPQLPPVVYPQKGKTNIVRADFPQSQALFVQKGIHPGDPRYIPMVILNQILGNSPSSRLFSQVRVQRGDAYSISTSLENYDKGCFLVGALGSANSRVMSNLNLVREIWAKVKEKGVTQEEFDDAKSYVLGVFSLNLVSSSQIAELAHYYQRWGYPVDYPQKRAALINSVTLEQINQFAKQFLDPQELTFIVVGKPDPIQDKFR